MKSIDFGLLSICSKMHWVDHYSNETESERESIWPFPAHIDHDEDQISEGDQRKNVEFHKVKSAAYGEWITTTTMHREPF